MIWILLTGAAATAAGAWLFARTLVSRLVIAGAGAAGLIGYIALGQPDQPDQPLSARVAELEAQAATNAESLTGDQVMAILQERARRDPADPMPHKFMGDLMAQVGRGQEAMLAYQAALRRDPNNLEAIKALADLSFRSSMQVDAATARLYRRAYELDPSDLRVGYMAGIGDWQAGRREEAEALWAKLEAQAPEGDARREMFKALRDMFTGEQSAPAAAPAAGQPQR
jgi:cytochrome c-type biogenesis protein CcmH